MVKDRSKDGHEIERNISHFKKMPKSNGSESDESDDEYDKDIKPNARDAQMAMTKTRNRLEDPPEPEVYRKNMDRLYHQISLMK